MTVKPKICIKEKEVLLKYQKMALFEDEELISFAQSGKLDDDTPFHVAAYDGNIVDLKVMLEAGVEINIKGDIGNTALHYAVMKRHADTVDFLVSKGALLTARNDYGDLPRDWIDENDLRIFAIFDSL